MLGAIIGDIAGSTFEFNNTKDYNFPLFDEESNFTDDSICSVAVAEWLVEDPALSHEVLEQKFVELANDYPCPMGGYGGGFHTWLFHPEYLQRYDGLALDGERVPYNSWGNGSAMRVSAVGWMFDTLWQTENAAEISASITHNHPEGIKGAQATAAAIFMARTGSTKEEIRKYIEERYGYDLHRTCDEIRPDYDFDGSCQGTVPEAMIAFLDSHDFEDAIRLAVSLGGDSDTLACITGGIAEAFYKQIPSDLAGDALTLLPSRFIKVMNEMREKGHYIKTY
jgi:ADP-ribosylglycohydrolase